MARSHSMVFALFAASVLSVLVGTGCLSDVHASYYYPSGVGSGGRVAWFWPANSAATEFRFAVQTPGQPLEDRDEQAVERVRVEDVARLAELAGQIDEATVVLSHSNVATTRGHAEALLASLSKRNAGIGTHVVVTDEELDRVTTTDAFTHRLRDLDLHHQESRPAGFGEAIHGMIGKMWTLQGQPNFWIAPLAADSGRFAVIGDRRRADTAEAHVALSSEEIVPWLTPRLAADEARVIQVTWGTNTANDGGQGSMMTTRAGAVLVAVLVPSDATSATRERCAALVRALQIDALAPIVVAETDVTWPAAELVDAESFAARLPSVDDWSFVTGTVRQSAVLPKPR